jgi:hypothetical protein
MPPRAGFASLEGYTLPRAESASLEASTLPRARSASLEDSTPPRARSASLEGSTPPSGVVRLARGLNAPSTRTTSHEGICTHVVHAPAPVQAFNALTPQDVRHGPNTPGNHVLTLFHQLPGEGHPRYCVALCDEAGVSPVTLCHLPPYG